MNHFFRFSTILRIIETKVNTRCQYFEHFLLQYYSSHSQLLLKYSNIFIIEKSVLRRSILNSSEISKILVLKPLSSERRTQQTDNSCSKFQMKALRWLRETRQFVQKTENFDELQLPQTFIIFVEILHTFPNYQYLQKGVWDFSYFVQNLSYFPKSKNTWFLPTHKNQVYQ